MGRTDNPYKSGTIKYKILDLDGTWDDMTIQDIANVIGNTKRSVRIALSEIKRELGYTVKRRDGKTPPYAKNGNPYWPGSIVWKLYEGDWSQKTIPEIAAEIGAKESTVKSYITQITKRTGKYIDFIDRRKLRSSVLTHKKV